MTTSQIDPVAHDHAYVARMLDLQVAQQARLFADSRLHSALGDRYDSFDGPREPARWAMTLGEILAAARQSDSPRVVKALGEYDTAQGACETIVADLAAMRAIYNAQPWARFWLVPGGHLHSSMECSTCNHQGNLTSFSLLPDLSGSTEEHAVEEYGSTLCTVCYPSAPVDWTDGSRVGRIEREAADSKAAEKAAKRAAMLEKALLPDGSELRLQGYDRPKTLIAGQRALSSTLGNVAFYGGTHPDQAKWAADARVLAEAIAAKLGTDPGEILQDAATKAAKRVAKDAWEGRSLTTPAEILASISPLGT